MVHTDIKITNNTKMNHIMVSFSDHCNSTFIDSVPDIHKNCQSYSIFFSDKPNFFSIAKSYFFSLTKITTPPQVTHWNIQNPALIKTYSVLF